jgi:hypothetical protein
VTTTRNNNTGQNNFTDYPTGNNDAYSAPELIFQLSLPAQSITTISLTNLMADLDLFVASSCNNTPLASSQNIGTVSESLPLTNSGGAASTVYLIVDGWAGATSSFDLSVNCVQNVKSDPLKTNVKTNFDIAIDHTRLISQSGFTKMRLGVPVKSEN